MKKGFTLAVVALVLIVGAATQARAEFPQNYSQRSVKDLSVTLMAMHHLNAHPEMVRRLAPEQLYWLLEGFERLARVPFVDHEALFRLQVRLTLHLLDLQVAKLNAVFGYNPHPTLGQRDKDEGRGRRYVSQPLILHPPWQVQRVSTFRFFTPLGCQLNQAKVVRQTAWQRELFVGPCQAAEGGMVVFNVWRVGR